MNSSANAGAMGPNGVKTGVKTKRRYGDTQWTFAILQLLRSPVILVLWSYGKKWRTRIAIVLSPMVLRRN